MDGRRFSDFSNADDSFRGPAFLEGWFADEARKRLEARHPLVEEFEASLPQRGYPGPGHHIADIPKGEFGEFSKIAEEFAEAQDAMDQSCKLMVLQELSDMVMATKGFLARYYPGITLDDLLHMGNITDRAHKNGHWKT